MWFSGILTGDPLPTFKMIEAAQQDCFGDAANSWNCSRASWETRRTGCTRCSLECELDPSQHIRRTATNAWTLRKVPQETSWSTISLRVCWTGNLRASLRATAATPSGTPSSTEITAPGLALVATMAKTMMELAAVPIPIFITTTPSAAAQDQGYFPACPRHAAPG